MDRLRCVFCNLLFLPFVLLSDLETMWTVTFEPNTDRDRVGQLVATWTEASGEVFVFTEDQINTNAPTQKTNFVNRAKARQAAWKTRLEKDKTDRAAIATEIAALLNA